MIERDSSGGSGRGGRLAAVITVGVLASVGVLVVVMLGVSGSPVTPRGEEEATARWRWESYRGIELRVPATWGNGGALDPGWCASTGTSSRSPGSVGRPGITPAIMCSTPYPPADQRTPSVGFSSSGKVGITELDSGWVLETRKIGDVFVAVFTDNDQLRTAIVDSAHTVKSEDRHGCPPQHAATIGRDYRPPTAGALPAADDVTSISLCRYLRSDHRGHFADDHGPGAAILSASRITGADAHSVLDALDTAPVGEGPNTPNNCARDFAYGDELLILRIHSDTSTREVLVRYHGCDGHGIDDGTTQRRLTPELLRPLLTGPHQPSMLSGDVGQLLARGPK